MINTKDSKSPSERLAAPLKAAVWFAVVGFVVLAVETPHWGMSPELKDETAISSAPASTPPTTVNFSAQFPAPKGEPEPVAPTF